MPRHLRRNPPDSRALQRIQDPAAHAGLTDPGPFQVADRVCLWSPWACHYTTTRDFGNVGGVAYHNNCGPTAVTNLICMLENRLGTRAGPLADPRALYDRIARYGVKHLFFVNSSHPLFHGSSDLRAGSWVRRMCRKLLGLRARIRPHLLREKPLLRAIRSGALVYLMLWNHPVYRTHHLLGYGYVRLRSQSTGRVKTYILVSDGHVPAPRYLDLDTARGAFYQVSFPTLDPPAPPET